MSLIKHIPNTITSMNAFCGTVGVVFALQGRPDLAFVLMLAASVCDFCDGLSARLLKAYSPLGKELDSMADMVSFGVLPTAILIGTMQLHGTESWTEVIPVFLAVMSALRLAKFNIDQRQGSDFIGLATTTSALICGSLCYFVIKCPGTFLSTWVATPWFLPALAVVLGLLLVSEIPMFGMKVSPGHKLMDAKRTLFLCLAAAAILATVILGLNWSLAVLLIFSSYVLENICLWVIAKIRPRP